MEKKSWTWKFFLGNRGIVGSLLLFAVIAIIGICGMYYTLLQNAHVLGRDLLHGYVQDEELNISKFQNQINLGMIYLDDMSRRNVGDEEKETWIRDYFCKIKETLSEVDVEAYAVVGGKLIAEMPWDGMEEYDFTQSDWYRKAVEANGAVIFTDVYQSANRGKWVVSMAAVDPESKDAIVLDLGKQTFQAYHQKQSLPENGEYFLCDMSGRLLYSSTHFSVPEEQLEAFSQNLYEMVKRGEVTEKRNEISGVNGEKRGVYYFYTNNGWFCAMTMAHSELLQGMKSLFGWYIAFLILFLLIVFVMGCKNRQLSLAVKKEKEIVQALGNSYYAFYRVNVKNNTYEIIKGSEYINTRTAVHGEYTRLLHMLAGIMDMESGKDFLRSFSPDKVKELIEHRVEGFGGDFLRKFGEEYCWVNVSLLVDQTLGEDEGVLCFRKVHEEKLHQRAYQKLLEDVLEEVEMSEKSQKQFFANMSHEMKTPLNIIIGMADMAQHHDTEKEKVRECLDKIKETAKQLAGFINDILESSRLHLKNMGQERKSFDMEEVVLECVRNFRVQAGREHKKFEVNINIENRKIEGNSLYLVHILRQLISNAIKFTNEGDRIEVRVSQAGEEDRLRYHFIVEDTGIGMPEEFLPKLFKPYATVGRFEKQRSGKGLGLAIVKNLVIQMGGVIDVVSELGKGSRFSVTLPFHTEGWEEKRIEENLAEEGFAGKVSAAEIQTKQEGKTKQEEKAGQAEQTAQEESGAGNAGDEKKEENGKSKLEGYRILVAEDNPLNMEIAVEFLQMAGAEVDCAFNGQEAVELFEKSEVGYYDAVVLDMQMPILDGCGAAEKIRKMERLDASIVPITALTANTLVEDVARTAHAGMNRHLPKPVIPEKLWDTLYELIIESREKMKNRKG